MSENSKPCRPSATLPKILVIDDDLDQLAILRIIFQRELFEVTSANSAKEGLEAVIQDNFNVVLCDVSMPEMNGLEFSDHCRNLPKLSNLPVVLMSAGRSLFDFSSIPSTADAFVMKQNMNKTLVTKIKQVMLDA